MLEVAKQSCVKPARVRFAAIKHFTKETRLADDIHAGLAFQPSHPLRNGAAFLYAVILSATDSLTDYSSNQKATKGNL